jgi:lipoprotein signal peptidase
MTKKIYSNKFYIITGSLMVVLLVALDQFVKYLAITKLKDKDSYVLIPGVFQLTYSENRGAAFGILQGQRPFFIISTILIVALMVYIYIKMPKTKKYSYMRIIMIMITAGALGNFIDRFRLHYVVDLFYFVLIDFAIFNVADSYIVVSCIALMILYIFYYKEEDFDFLTKKGGTKDE